MNPKVFISHASEDKDRFVTEFATKLRSNGVDAWFDKWERLPGDSLVDKIFEKGLKEANAVIIILSNYSVDKPWVREELNASIVNRIKKGTKLIPVVLDECKVPESLKATLWESISDLNSYDENFKRILSSIFGAIDKPPLGNTPVHTSSKYHEIGDLTKADNLVLKESCEFAIQNNDFFVEPEAVFGNGSGLGFSRGEITDCIEILEGYCYFDVSRCLGSRSKENYSCFYRITSAGFEQYARAYIDGYDKIIDNVVSAIINENIRTNKNLSSKIGQPLIIINHILNLLELNGHVKLSKQVSRIVQIYHVAASLRRLLGN